MNAIDRTHIDTRAVFGADAGFADDIGHCLSLLLNHSEGLRPSDSLHALSRAASPARFRLRAKRYGETSPKPWRRRAVRVARFAALARIFAAQATDTAGR